MRPVDTFIVCLAVLFVVSPVLGWGAGAVYFVAPSGGGGCSTNINAPSSNLQGSVNCLGAGDILYIRTGTYTQPVTDPPGGTSWSNAVTIAGYPGERPRLRSNNANSPVIDAVNVSSSWVILDNLILDGAGSSNNAVIFVGSHGNPSGPHHWRLTNVEIDGANYTAHQGFVGDVDGLEILNSEIHHAGTLANAHFEHGLYVGGSSMVIDHNDIHHNAGYGIHAYNGGDSSRIHDGRFTNNLVHDQVSEWGVIISSGANNRLYNNVIWNNPHGIQLDFGGDNTLVANNTIYRNQSSANGSCVYIGGSSSNTIQNNICWQNNQDQVTGNTGGNTIGPNLIVSDPLFVNPGAGDFHLQSGSPAASNGQNLAAFFTTDLSGATRGTPFGYGAYAPGGSGVVPAPTNFRVLGN